MLRSPGRWHTDEPLLATSTTVLGERPSEGEKRAKLKGPAPPRNRMQSIGFYFGRAAHAGSQKRDSLICPSHADDIATLTGRFPAGSRGTTGPPTTARRFNRLGYELDEKLGLASDLGEHRMASITSHSHRLAALAAVALLSVSACSTGSSSDGPTASSAPPAVTASPDSSPSLSGTPSVEASPSISPTST